MSAEIIAVVNQKGGTGKTTTTVNLGVALGKLGNKVLVVDFDAQASLTYYFGITSPLKGSISDVIFGDREFPNIILSKEGIDIAPATIELADAELSLASYGKRTTVMKEMLDTVKHRYDYILIDCGPSLSLLTVNSLTAAHSIIIPLMLEVLALQGLTLIRDTIERIRKSFNPDIKVKGVLLLMVDLRRSVTQEVYQLLLKNSPFPLFKAHIEIDDRAVEAPSFGQSILSYAPNTVSATGYFDLATEISL